MKILDAMKVTKNFLYKTAIRMKSSLDRAYIKLSRANPLVFMLIYVLIIPVFAFEYTLISNSFYAPYSRMEPYFQSDIDIVSKIFSTAMKRNINERQQAGSEWVWDPDYLNISNLRSDDGNEFKFSVNIMAHKSVNRNGIYQTLVNMSWSRGANVLLASESDSNGKTVTNIFRILDINKMKFPFEMGIEFNSMFNQFERDFAKIRFTEFENDRIEEFEKGASGDPISLTNSYMRMFYFSSIVITTVGFGDIIPITNMARISVAIEAILGILLAGLFINAIAFRSSASIIAETKQKVPPADGVIDNMEAGLEDKTTNSARASSV